MTPNLTAASRRNLAGLLSNLARPLPSTVRQPATRPVVDVDLRAVLTRVASAGHPPEDAAALAELWSDLPERTRAQIANPLWPGSDRYLRLGARRAVQTSNTTCGSAVLVLLLAAGDPIFATWLATGRPLGSLPQEVRAAAEPTRVESIDAADPDDGPVRRFAAAQAAMLSATSRNALGPFPWPTALGTPPWTAARHARFPGVRYTHRPVDDADRREMTRLVSWLTSSLARGVPVPLYTGGDLLLGLGTAVPRHVVLAVPPGPHAPSGTLSIYEPTRGRVHHVPPAELEARRMPHRALGGWTHVCWAVLPRAVRPSSPSSRPVR